MPAAFAGIKVENQAEVMRAFGHVSAGLKKEMRAELQKVAEPVKPAATRLAHANITNITGRWSEFKIGVTAKSVYVAPQARRRRGSPRKNLGVLLLEQAMWPAVEQRTPQITREFERWLDSLAARADFK